MSKRNQGQSKTFIYKSKSARCSLCSEYINHRDKIVEVSYKRYIHTTCGFGELTISHSPLPRLGGARGVGTAPPGAGRESVK